MKSILYDDVDDVENKVIGGEVKEAAFEMRELS